MKEWHKKNKEKSKLITRRSFYEARLEVLQYYSKLEVPECKCCGESTFEFLQIDHINNDGAEHRRKTRKEGSSNFVYWLKKNGMPEGYQILCANCNTGKRTNSYCPHEIKNGVDMNGNKIEIVKTSFPERTKRKRNQAKEEAEELGLTMAQFYYRNRKI